jgi:GT2 family glycosyltransferase
VNRDSKLVAVIIPALHRPDLTEHCLLFLGHQTLSPNSYESIVVENDAQPESILKDPLPPNVRRILLEKNYGTTVSINRAIADSSSKYVLLLNNDVELEPQFMSNLVGAMEADQDRAFTTGKLLRATQRDCLDGAGDALLMGGGAYRLGHLDKDTGQFEKEGWVLAGCGAATLFRRSVLEEIHGLDEDFFAYLDDIDLAMRAQLLGYTGHYVPGAVGYHIGSATLGSSMHPKVVELITRNQLYLIVKDYPRSVLWKLLLRILVFQALWFAVILRHKRVRAYFRGLLGAGKSIRRVLRKRAQFQQQRRIANEDFLSLLRASERQVFDWHSERSADSRCQLLNIYFHLFGAPPRPLQRP